MSTLACFFKSLHEKLSVRHGHGHCTDSLDLTLQIEYFSFDLTVFISSVIGILNQAFGFVVVIRCGIIMDMFLVLK